MANPKPWRRLARGGPNAEPGQVNPDNDSASYYQSEDEQQSMVSI
jgi:hypothetical protein